MGAVVGDVRDERGGGGAGADHHDLLVGEVDLVGPLLRVDHLALEVVEAGPLGRVAGVVPVVALAHPEEAGGEVQLLVGVGAADGDLPPPLVGGPLGGVDAVVVADVRLEVVLVDHLAEVLQDLLGAGDGRTEPGLEAVAEGEQVAVGADARVAVRPPGAAEAVEGIQQHEAGPRPLLLQVDRAPDARDAGPHDEHVDVLALASPVMAEDRTAVLDPPVNWPP